MTTPKREDVSEALFALIKGTSVYVTAERKVRLIDAVPREERPAIFMLEPREDDRLVDDNPSPLTIRTWTYRFFIYVWNQDSPSPASVLNPMLDAIEDVLRPNVMSGYQTLGGLVYRVLKLGETIKVQGDLDGDGIAVVPVVVVVP